MSLRRLSLTSFALFTAALGLFAQAQPDRQKDNLNARYANGIAAIAEDRIITIDDIRREVGPLIPLHAPTAGQICEHG